MYGLSSGSQQAAAWGCDSLRLVFEAVKDNHPVGREGNWSTASRGTPVLLCPGPAGCKLWVCASRSQAGHVAFPCLRSVAEGGDVYRGWG